MLDQRVTFGQDVDQSDEPLSVKRPDAIMGRDLTDLARSAPPAPSPYDQDPVYAGVFERLSRALHRTDPRHVIMVGDRGVAMPAVLAESARQALASPLPRLRRLRFVLFDARFVPADTHRDYLLALLARSAPREDLVMCIDGFGALLRSEHGVNHARWMLTALAGVRGRVLGLCDPRDYEELLADDPDVRESFTRVDIPEPGAHVARGILSRYAAELEREFGVSIDEDALRDAVTLTTNYVLSERLPDKAARVLRRVCQDVDFEHARNPAAPARITASAVLDAVSDISGVPRETLQGIAQRGDYEQSLREVIVGQDHVVREVAAELALIKAGLNCPGKPASVLLFLGQTGTGKTELAKALARFYSRSKRLRTYTLGNFIEPHSVSGIIGVPAGYVGHDAGGRLVNDLNADPYCVVLLDEADKAHPDVLQPLLNLFDEGWLRDQRGVQAFADKAIFVLTANVGQRMIADMARQGLDIATMTSRMKDALSQIRHTKSNRPVFPPELLARIKRILLFQPLDHAAMLGICRRQVAAAQRMWRERRQRELNVADALVEFLAQRATEANAKSEGREGGRIVHKLFSDLVDSAIQRAATQRPSDYQHSAKVVVDWHDNPPRAVVRFIRREEPARSPGGDPPLDPNPAVCSPSVASTEGVA